MRGFEGGPGIDTTVCGVVFLFVFFLSIMSSCDLPDNKVAPLSLGGC